jgi:hypothetical protein
VTPESILSYLSVITLLLDNMLPYHVAEALEVPSAVQKAPGSSRVSFDGTGGQTGSFLDSSSAATAAASTMPDSAVTQRTGGSSDQGTVDEPMVPIRKSFHWVTRHGLRG